ncbi:MAG TPA: hypothetical protein PLD82_03340 [Spirochaetota bacterium]|nr:hypothetical protein [Spirochaetota bacterium]
MASILIVDDSAFVTTQLTQILVKGGHTVSAALPVETKRSPSSRKTQVPSIL